LIESYAPSGGLMLVVSSVLVFVESQGYFFTSYVFRVTGCRVVGDLLEFLIGLVYHILFVETP
jgi:hypothetical protein